MFNAKYKPTIIATQPDIGDLRQEFNENGMHRIVHSDGTATPFVPYRDFAYFGGYVSVTAFWADEGLYSAADFALMVATGVVATQQQAADFNSGKGRVLMRDLVDTPVAVSVATNSPKDYTKKPVSYCEDVLDCEDDLVCECEDDLGCEGCTHIRVFEDDDDTHIVEDDVSGDAEPELREKLRERATNMLSTLLAAAAKPVTRH